MMVANTCLRALLATLLLAASLPALAAYRCVADGKVSYSDTACPGGQEINIQDAPTSVEAVRRAAQEKKQLAEIERAANRRAKAEEKERRRLARAEAAQQRRCEKLELRKKWAEQDAAEAKGAALKKSQRKASRAGEQYRTECAVSESMRNGMRGASPR